MNKVHTNSNVLTLSTAGFLVSLILFSSTVSAQVIGNWNFNGNLSGTGSSFNSVSSADFSTSTPGRSFNGGSEYFGQDGWPSGGLDPALYLSFTLSPNPGYGLNILSLNLRMRHSNTGSSGGSGPTRFTVRSSLDGYIADLGTGSITGSYANFIFSAGPSFHQVASPVTFRVYGHNTVMHNGGNNRFVFDNIAVDAIGVVLPARLELFEVKATKQGASIVYRLNDIPADTRIAVERSADNLNYQTVKAVTENDYQVSRQFTMIDDPPDKSFTYYYRLRLEFTDRSSYYSTVRIVKLTNNPQVLSASTRAGVLKVKGIFDGANQLSLMNSAGSIVFSTMLQNNMPVKEFEMFIPPIKAGIYYIRVTGKGRIESTAILIDQARTN